MLHRALVLVVVASSGIAAAQPSLTAPSPYAYAPPPPPLQLTADEQSTLQIGYISDGQMIGGGLASLFLSFGIGQAIEGRWSDTGWIFTLGEPLALGVVIYGATQLATCDTPRGGSCGNNNTGGTALAIGAIGIVGLRIWEIVDAFTGPGRQNARFWAVQARLGNPTPFYASPYVVPTTGGAVAGLSVRF